MCNQPNCHHDLNDDLSDLTGAPADVAFAKAALSNATSLRTFETPCPSCKGSGRFRSYTGRIVGDCFKCKGRGVIRTKTDPAKLEANREKAAAKRAAEAATAADKARQWLLDNPDEAAWLAEAAGRGFEFAAKMRDALLAYGHLTEKQEAATAYGKATGQCSCCGRELTNEESIARAIGPICLSKWGWA